VGLKERPERTGAFAFAFPFWCHCDRGR
jgi:hypothetical protein